MLAYGLIIIFILNIIYAVYNLKERLNAWNIVSIIGMVAFSIVLLFKLETVPTMFFDEANGMYDSWALSKYGVDSNLNSNPIYLQSFAGQGQSILYARLVGTFFKILGYNVYVYRLPLVLVSLTSVILLFNVLNAFDIKSKSIFLTVMVFCTSPWLIMISRFGMDCNISPFMVLIGTLLLLLSTRFKIGGVCTRILVGMLGTFILGLTAYSYNVGWMYLLIFIPGIFGVFYLSKNISVKELLLYIFILLLELIPIMIFAIRSNIDALNKTVHIFIWTYPKLLSSRASESMISFDGDVLHNIVKNVLDGGHMFLNNTDGLPWNSIPGIGAYYPIMLPFLMIGIIISLYRRNIIDKLLILGCMSSIPIMLVVTPNYNHWIFIHFVVLGFITIGINEIFISKKVQLAIVMSYAILFLNFSSIYFQQRNIAVGQYDVNLIKTIKRLKTKNYKKVYFDTTDFQFLMMIRDLIPISPYEYQATKDNPNSKEILTVNSKFENYQMIDSNNMNQSIEKNSLILIDVKKDNGNLAKNKKLKKVGQDKISSETYNVYKTTDKN